MNKNRRDELDNIISDFTIEFRENANTEGRFGALYLSCDTETNDVQMCLECAREPFVRMIISLMEESPAIAEDIIKATEHYEPRDPLNLKYIAG